MNFLINLFYVSPDTKPIRLGTLRVGDWCCYFEPWFVGTIRDNIVYEASSDEIDELEITDSWFHLRTQARIRYMVCWQRSTTLWWAEAMHCHSSGNIEKRSSVVAWWSYQRAGQPIWGGGARSSRTTDGGADMCGKLWFHSCCWQRKSGGERDPCILVGKRALWGILLTGEPAEGAQPQYTNVAS